jgi:hypothetical protein
LSDNATFRAAGRLGKDAEHYPDAAVAADGKKLTAIGKSKSTNSGALMSASSHVANVCGHPLGIGG